MIKGVIMKDYTKEYYDNNAENFIVSTIECDMQEQYDLLEKYLKDKSTILDLGFGSGRDMLYFKSKGFEVSGIDYSEKFCEHAKEIGIKNVYNCSIMNFDSLVKFDAIWACASLLHIPKDDLELALKKCYNLLKDDGYMYVSFKYGDFEGEKKGRYFTYMTENLFRSYYQLVGFKFIETSISEDVRKDRNNKWLNVILKK
jgi:SAM-dependent methyltransferase